MGALVQANYGSRDGLTIAGVPVGRAIADLMPSIANSQETGSIIVVIATDAPLLPHQLRRVAMRCGLGIARNGGTGGNFSGDLFIAFSTANAGADDGNWSFDPSRTATVTRLRSGAINPVLEATVQGVEEAVINARVAARTMTGADYWTVSALPHDQLQQVLRAHAVLKASPPK